MCWPSAICVSGVTGAGFVTLAATLAIIPDIPIQLLALIIGIDKFMSECRALINLIGNGVATVVISRWEKELDVDALHETMAHLLTVGEEIEALPVSETRQTRKKRKAPAFRQGLYF